MPLPHDSDHGDDHGDRNRDRDRGRNRVAAGQVSGTVVQIGSVHGAVEVGAPAPAPHQLPASPRLFTDRNDETRRLHALHDTGSGTGSGTGTRTGSDTGTATGTGHVVVLHGTGGVGKTALATHFLSTVADTLPDGVLHCDLLGFSGDGPADPGDVLDRFLRDLGTAPEHIPHDLAGRAAAFRSCTHGRRIGLLLDNAVSAAQVRPLLPGDGGHLVLVTTRLHLSGLRLDGAEFLELGPLDGSGSAELVERILSDGRARAEPDAVSRLTDLCGGLPLAVCAAVSGLTVRRHQPLSRLVDRLSRARHRLSALSALGALSAGPEMSVEAALTDSYRWLGPGAQRMYRLLGLAPGRDLTPEAAAALAGLPLEEAEELLTELLTASLLEEGAGGRLRQHDLTRLHARARAEADESEGEREQTLDRILEHYLVTAASADRVLNPHRWTLGPVYDRLDGPAFPSHDQALSWLEEELPVLRACVRTAHDTGRHRTCWQLCEALRSLFTLRKHFEAWAETHLLGDASARTLDHNAAQGRMALALAAAQRSLGDLETAHSTYLRSLDLWQRTDHELGIASSLEGCGMSEVVRGRPVSAVPYFRRAYDVYERIGDARGRALISRRLGRAFRDAGRHGLALAHFSRALDGFPAEYDAYQRARTLGETAAIHLARADHRAARVLLEEAFALAESVGAIVAAAGHLVMRAEAAQLAGHLDDARDDLTRALSTYTAHGDPAAQRTRQLLEDLDS
ncbi:tetratricopeptide repeat protein [Nocardiopsis sp. HNM0947]|uniref:Tetratricopeptide repeat protein n=1 Tax=Nocardiopsis coralli TaxID=2772213 RepID=A0ABR9P2A1_9ACTN|nr:tetratricopeptide repeat protein [Nocardiopsis coralli]MBE2997967.1 tetratricopeptide repeat protein [Nocardiopsis coralli]